MRLTIVSCSQQSSTQKSGQSQSGLILLLRGFVVPIPAEPEGPACSFPTADSQWPSHGEEEKNLKSEADPAQRLTAELKDRFESSESLSLIFQKNMI